MAEDGYIEVHVSSEAEYEALKVRLKDLQPVLAYIGGQMIAQSRNAFDQQKLGDTPWPARYPAQKDPFINIAPVVFRAGMGKKPTADDFRRRPALFAQPWVLKNGIGILATNHNSVEIGHPEKWSGMFQFGGIGRIAITETTRKTIGEWLTTATGKPSQKSVTFDKYHPGRGQKGEKGYIPRHKVGSESFGKRSDYAKKLSFVFFRDALVSKTYPRPFLGMTPLLYAEIKEAIARHVHGRKPGSSDPLPPLPNDYVGAP